MPEIRLSAWDNSDEYRKLAEKLYEQRRLEEILRSGGDRRLGGSIPIGGKAYAWTPRGTSKPVNTLAGIIPHPAEAAGHDAYMNIIESILEDLRRNPK